jgi:3-methyladenine DNA glycosylase AlkD
MGHSAGARSIVETLRAEADPTIRREMAERYGIHTDRAFGLPMRRLKALAKPLAPNHGLALDLWASGWYETRTMASFIDDPTQVTTEQMHGWAKDFDNWAIVDSVCFNLFDRAPERWSMVEPWAGDDREFVKRAGFALLWALALHDRSAPDASFEEALPLVETNATDDRHLVTTAMTMALRAIGTQRPRLRRQVMTLAERLASSPHPRARKVGRPIVNALGPAE